MTNTFSEASPLVAGMLDVMYDRMTEAMANGTQAEAMRQFYVLIQGLLAMQADLLGMTAEQSKLYCEVLLADHLLNIGVGIDDSERH